MVSLAGIVHTVVLLIVGAVILGLLWWLVGYCEAKLGGPAQVWAVIRIIFVVLVVLLLIGLLLSFVSGQPLFR